MSGKMLGDDQPFTHHNDITTLSLSQAGPASQRLLAFLDKNNDLYISSIQGKHKAFPLGKSGVSFFLVNQGVSFPLEGQEVHSFLVSEGVSTLDRSGGF